MTLYGHIHDGKVVLNHTGPLPEGAAVQVQIVTSPSSKPDPDADEQLPTLAERLKEFIGCMGNDLPPDLSVNLDHYLYGAPKQK